MLKLEVNKVYLTQNRGHVKILVQDGATYVGRLMYPALWTENINKLYEFGCDGSSLNLSLCTNLVEEYKPPVVHHRDILWVKDRTGVIICYTYPVGKELNQDYYALLKRETISYEEK